MAIPATTIVFCAPALATGTSAGTTITNTATATYTNSVGQPVSVPSNKVDLKVDEVINVKVASADPGDVSAFSGGTNQILSFNITNTGNGSEAFRLAPVNAIGGDAFDPSTTSIVLDTNHNGVYDAGVDTVYAAGSNDPVLAADGSIRAFILSTIPGTATDGQRGQTDLTATAVTGTGPAGTVFTGVGDGGGDAVIGTSTGVGRDKGFYIVSAATVSFVKSATIADPFGGTRSVPGSVITYTLVATVSGSGALSNLAVTDPIPAATTYVVGSLTLQGAALTDATDSDAGEFSGTAIAARFGGVAAGQTRTVTFKTKIN
ncbi:hypothetical protein [Sphingomonas sp.]|uniref:hypothetical protein n=1 Tax=Sphingomonas sp. TaxID=28214 RepID=UPI0025FAF129|nr:hypothetical protein [Sphingomonas sp.]